MKSYTSFAIACLLSSLTPAFGQVTVDLGNHILQPNQADQFIPITVSGGDSINRGLLSLDISGAGTEPKFGITFDFTSPSFFAGGATAAGAGFIFDGEPVTLNTAPLPSPQNAVLGVLLDSGTDTVAADGIFAAIAIDTTGVSSGTFALTDFAGGTRMDNVSGVDISGAVLAGTITVVPEPGSLAVLSTGLAALIYGRRRRS